MSDITPGVVIDVPAVLWDAMRDGVDCPPLMRVILDAKAGDGSQLKEGAECSFGLDRPTALEAEQMRRRGRKPEDQLTGFLAFLGLALVWSTESADAIVLRRTDTPLTAMYEDQT